VTGCTPEHDKNSKAFESGMFSKAFVSAGIWLPHRLQQAVRRARKSHHPTGCLFLR